MARSCKDASDKALWITLAQSWVRLAEHVARTRAGAEAAPGKEALAVQPVD